ncbi:MAG TPA: DUF3014 domain-containing protein [Steroidobacteraceae bacterium]|jgi:hypothetical protein|nr:DUF3014 domain-containing protein [Steroidobacteraceae bacterium]
MQKHIWWVGAALVLIAAVVLFFSWRANRHAPPPAATAPAPSAPAPAIQNPVPAAPTPQPLPPLQSSDGPLHEAMSELMGKRATDSLLKPEQLIRHIVVTVDNLSRKKAAFESRPTKPLPGSFMAKGDEQHSILDPSNYQRYTAIMQVVQMVDSKQLAALYFHYYPLFQQEYQNQGYPNGYFNDRLVATIDNLLATPDVSGDIVLVRPNVMYQFADPNLEDLSAGQKALLRVGPQNAAIIKAKLRELRTQIASAPH